MNQKFTAHHRRCLQNGCCGGPGGEHEAQLGVGAKVRQECIDAGWLERMPDSPAGHRMYRTTELGRAMLEKPRPPKSSGRPRVTLLDSNSVRGLRKL